MNRPVLKLRRTKSEWIWDIIGGLSFISAIVFLIISWAQLPEQVPGHYNAAGEVDRWGSKFELFILPIIGIFMWLFLGILEKFPHVHNYPDRLNEANAEAFYLNSRKLLNVTKNICLISFGTILVQSIRLALGWSESLGMWFLPVLCVGVMIPIILGMVRASKIK
ncbi:DUF1648 domain-containing protein [Cytobacillus purgationiresistens]|uniref:Membrane protein n=1 Tax=Cytobacillus purgationiresistens TaxID=863449 RepID=A0ABU0AJJ8_9BACI|nr:DUF1648 domain-containing protein [Cytobacillus purgationiresistens]MDQ0270588.1 putative membrane protein [Cytobacillus purgationiresistens]